MKHLLILFIAGICFSSCKKENVEPELSVSPATVSFPAEGNTSEIILTSNASWDIGNSASWLQLSQINGNSSNATIQVTAGLNATGFTRSTVLVVNANNGQSRRVSVSQASQMYPSYNTSPKPP